jgi:hypothetical protein
MAISATLNLRDAFGRLTKKKVETTDTVLATAITHIAAYATALDALTDLALESVEYHSVDTSAAFTGETDSNVDTGATFKLKLADASFASYKIPGIKLSKVNAAGSIDPADTDVAALFALFATGANLRVSDGEAVDSVIFAALDR